MISREFKTNKQKPCFILILLKGFRGQFLRWRIKHNFTFDLSVRCQGIYSLFHLSTRESSPLILADNLLFSPPSHNSVEFCNRFPPIHRIIRRASKDFLYFRCCTKEKNSTKQDATCMLGCSNANQEFKRSHLFWFLFLPQAVLDSIYQFSRNLSTSGMI